MIQVNDLHISFDKKTVIDGIDLNVTEGDTLVLMGKNGSGKSVVLKAIAGLIDRYDGGPAGIKTIAISVGEEIDTLEDYYEPFLVQIGLLKRTPRGRVATPEAYKHLGKNWSKALENSTQETLF